MVPPCTFQSMAATLWRRAAAARPDSQRFRFRMANIKSQMKRNRQNETRNLRNKSIRSELKTRVKNALEAAEAGDAEKAEELTRQAQKRIDMAVTKGILHKNTAARRKAKLVRDVSQRLGS